MRWRAPPAPRPPARSALTPALDRRARLEAGPGRPDPARPGLCPRPQASAGEAELWRRRRAAPKAPRTRPAARPSRRWRPSPSRSAAAAGAPQAPRRPPPLQRAERMRRARRLPRRRLAVAGALLQDARPRGARSSKEAACGSRAAASGAGRQAEPAGQARRRHRLSVGANGWRAGRGARRAARPGERSARALQPALARGAALDSASAGANCYAVRVAARRRSTLRGRRGAMSFVRVNGAVAHYLDEGPRDCAGDRVHQRARRSTRPSGRVVRPLAGAIASCATTSAATASPSCRPARRSSPTTPITSLALIDRLGVEGATVVGLSIGGLVAQELYRQRPDLVAALALCDTAAKIGYRGKMAPAHRRGGARAASKRSPTRRCERWFTAEFRPGAPTISPAGGDADPLSARRLSRRLRRAGAADLRPDCAPIKGPDPVRGRRRRRFDAAAAGARVGRPVRPARFESRRRPGHCQDRTPRRPARPDRALPRRGGLIDRRPATNP